MDTGNGIIGQPILHSKHPDVFFKKTISGQVANNK